MENEETTKEYALIDAFMGWVVKEDGQGMYKKNNDGITNAYKSTGYSDYKNKWDQLMPVVERIEDVTTNVGFKIFKNLCLLQADNNTQISSIDLKSKRKIDHVYNVIIQFIEWHNLQQPVNNITPM